MTRALMVAAAKYDDPRYFSKSEIRIQKNRMRRNRIVKRQRFMLISMLAIVFITALFIFFTLKADAESDKLNPEYKYYRQITVMPGDSLSSIATDNLPEGHYKNAEAYGHEIACINHIADDDMIYAGDSIVIPYYSKEWK